MDPGRETQAQSPCQGMEPRQKGREGCQNGTPVQYGKITEAKRTNQSQWNKAQPLNVEQQ